MRTLAAVSSATRMRAGLLTSVEYTRAAHAVGTHRPRRRLPAARPARRPRPRRGAHPELGAAQAAGRLHAGHAALPAHGRLQCPDHPADVAAHGLARRGPPARRPLAPAAALAGHAAAP